MDNTWLTYVLILLNIALIVALTSAIVFAWYAYKDMQTTRQLRKNLEATVEEFEAERAELLNNMINESAMLLLWESPTPKE